MQEKYNAAHGIVPQTIIKGIRDINDRLRAVAEASGAYATEGRERQLSKRVGTQRKPTTRRALALMARD